MSAEQSSSEAHRHIIVLSEMNAIGIHCQSNVDAVIHDEQCATLPCQLT
jgi:hypothetical protein